MTFVVSEETGGISITYNGSFKHNLTLDEFETELREILLPKEEAGLSFKERLLGGWKHEKNSLYIISSLFLLVSYLSMLRRRIFKTVPVLGR